MTTPGRSGPEPPTAAEPGHVLPRSWSWYEDGAHDGVTNMATDQALLDTVRHGRAVWRWYAWERPTVSFGRNERLAHRVDADRLAATGLAAVRRPTGGRSLLHWRELTYSVAMPLAGTVPWRTAYDAINRLLLAALHRLGVPARLAAAGAAVPPEGPVCFEEPSEGEITVGSRKLVGSAVWRQGGGYLQHGSLLLHDDQSMLLALQPGSPPPPPAATLSSTLAGMQDEEIGTALRAALLTELRATLGQSGSITPFVPDVPFDGVLASQRQHFADASWLWRR